jgi:hypothetical protein
MVKVGGEVDAVCGKCEMVLAHTVHAVMGGQPVKVECNTCHVVHRYRAAPGAAVAARSGPAKPRAVREKAVTIPFESMLAGKDQGSARRYSPRDTFTVDQVVDHPTFGRGFVSGVRDGGKIEVTFRSDVKILVHGRA